MTLTNTRRQKECQKECQKRLSEDLRVKPPVGLRLDIRSTADSNEATPEDVDEISARRALESEQTRHATIHARLAKRDVALRLCNGHSNCLTAPYYSTRHRFDVSVAYRSFSTVTKRLIRLYATQQRDIKDRRDAFSSLPQ